MSLEKGAIPGGVGDRRHSYPHFQYSARQRGWPVGCEYRFKAVSLRDEKMFAQENVEGFQLFECQYIV